MIKMIDVQDNWITAIVHGRWIQAKIYNEPSTFGINNGRISKLVISKTDGRDPDKSFLPQMAYNYDRGEDFNRIEPGLLNKIVRKLEGFPRQDF